jgi:trans-2,3-dihydro-3-hydroxyanthranilate isomerase
VFTATPLSGNGLAVVQDADGIDEGTMLAFARETRLSETTFVQRATVAGADYRNRIWMMGGELPFAGHPSLGTAVAVALARGESEARYVQQTPAGLQPIEVRLDGTIARAAMLQGPAEHGPELDPERVMAAAGLTAADAAPGLAPQIVSVGTPHVMAPVRDRATLARAVLDRSALEPFMAEHGAVVLYLAACEPATETARARGLFMDPGTVMEDPATGSAAGPLLAYLHARTGAERLTIEQGVEMGRPSRLDCEVDGDRIRVGGDVVVLGRGTIEL